MIPPKIHFIWIGGEFKESYTYGIRSAQLNTRCQIFLHTDNPSIDIPGVIVKLITPPEIKVKYIAHLTDIIRLEILYREGGIYSDLDCIWLRNPWELFDKKFVIGYSNESYKILVNCVILAEEGHPALLKYRDWLVSIMPCKKYWIPANPYKILKDEPDVLFVKKCYFSPASFRQIQGYTLDKIKNSIAVHLYASLGDIETTYRNLFGRMFDS
jgi:hypothetical protein